jgi:hypothetical protein
MTISEYSLDCPECKARAGWPCTTPKGNPCRIHYSRLYPENIRSTPIAGGNEGDALNNEGEK